MQALGYYYHIHFITYSQKEHSFLVVLMQDAQYTMLLAEERRIGSVNIDSLNPNEGKKLMIMTDNGAYARYPVKTHVVMDGDALEDIVMDYVEPFLEPNDMIFISEKVVAISQGRAFPIDEITVSRLAKVLCKYVYKSPFGIGLASPYTMELAIRDIGYPLILFAAFCSAIGKLLGIKGVFYKIVGMKGRAIDGPCECTIPPYNRYAKMAPNNPSEVAMKLSEKTGCTVVIIDSNDLSCDILGKSSKELDDKLLRQIFNDNPLGQGAQQTPIAIVRKVSLATP